MQPAHAAKEAAMQWGTTLSIFAAVVGVAALCTPDSLARQVGPDACASLAIGVSHFAQTLMS